MESVFESRMSASRPFITKLMREYPLLSREEERALVERASGGDVAAREQLVLSNLRLVVSVARRRLRMAGSAQFPDLISSGIIGLIHAANRVDERYKNKFSTYAIFWIRQSITHALEDCTRAVQLPRAYIIGMSKYMSAEQKLAQKHFRKPTVAEIAEELQVPKSQVLYLQSLCVSEVSLDEPMFNESGDGSAPFSDFITVECAPLVDEALERSGAKAAITLALDVLSPRERMIIELRYGLLGDDPMGPTEVGKALGVVGERVRQIESRALNKLRFSKVFRDKQQCYL